MARKPVCQPQAMREKQRNIILLVQLLLYYLSVYLSIYLSIYLFVYLCRAIYLSTYLSIYVSIYLSIYLSIWVCCILIDLSIYLSVCLSIYYLSICLSIGASKRSRHHSLEWQSEEHNGDPALHMPHGVPRALCTLDIPTSSSCASDTPSTVHFGCLSDPYSHPREVDRTQKTVAPPYKSPLNLWKSCALGILLDRCIRRWK